MHRIAVLILLGAAFLAGAEPPRKTSRTKKLWLASLGALVAANFVDAHSSWGYPETNAALRSSNGRFGPRAVAVKSGIVGAVIGLEWFSTRKARHADATLAVVNFASAGALARVAANNYRMRATFPLSPAPPAPR